MVESAVLSSSLPESVCGRDERLQVEPKTSPPYNWICSLVIKDFTGTKWVGSGFKINLPGSTRTAVVTSGHCTYIRGAYASSIKVTFPEKAEIEVGKDDLYASPEYIATGDADYDYGLILLPGANTSDGFGWSAVVPDSELDDRIVTNCGYPADKPDGTLWITGGSIASYTASRIFYMNDTIGGQSGSPVYTWHSGFWTVLGVHSYGGCPNSAPRFTQQMTSRFVTRMGDAPVVALRSVYFQDIYIRVDGNGVTAPIASGGGIVNAQYKPPGDYEKFYMWPLEVPPSLALPSIVARASKVALESTAFSNVFIRLDGTGLTRYQPRGGGVVNCQFGQGPKEVYVLRKHNDGSFSIQSDAFPDCYIRLDGSGISNPSGTGGGKANCQWYYFPPKSSWECFYIENQ